MAYVGSGTCGSMGLSDVNTANECVRAAIALQLQDTNTYEIQLPDRPVGCIYNTDPHRLVWADPSGHPNPNVQCGSLDFEDKKFDCICSGMVNILCRSIVSIKLDR